jgi:hypothetical protein
MSLCLSNLPQNRVPKWELSLASYENTALSKRQLWTISEVFHPHVSLHPQSRAIHFFRPRRGFLFENFQRRLPV